MPTLSWPMARLLEAGKCQARNAELVAAGRRPIDAARNAAPPSGTITVVPTVVKEKVGNCTVWAAT